MVSNRKMPEEVKRWRKEAKEYLTFQELPAWVRSAIAGVIVCGYTIQDAEKKYGKSGLGKYMNHSPGAQEWIQELKEQSKDPKAMAEAAFVYDAHNIAIEYQAAYQKCIAANDYAMTAKMSQDMLDRAGVTKKKEQGELGKISVQLNFGGDTEALLNPPMLKATYETLDEEDDEDYEILTD